MLCQRVRVRLRPEFVQQPRRTLDVSEHEGHGRARELAGHARMIAARGSLVHPDRSRTQPPDRSGDTPEHWPKRRLSSLSARTTASKKGLKKMADKRVWFITGAGRGMGVDIAQAALAAGHAVVATGRNTEAVADAVGEADDLLVVKLDITSPASAEAAVQDAVDRFGRIEVLVNNAGNFYAGYFEELTPEQIE